MEFIQYNLAGKIVKHCSVDLSQLDDYLMGEKVRITMDDGHIYIGFWNKPYNHEVSNTIRISQYDLDENTSQLRSFNDDTLMFIPSTHVVKIEVILYSNPR